MGLPQKSLMFLCGILLLPERAGIKASLRWLSVEECDVFKLFRFCAQEILLDSFMGLDSTLDSTSAYEGVSLALEWILIFYRFSAFFFMIGLPNRAYTRISNLRIRNIFR